MNGNGFHVKGKNCKPQLIFKDFEVKFPVQYLLYSLGNHDFWNLQSFLILKHYLGGVSACKKSF